MKRTQLERARSLVGELKKTIGIAHFAALDAFVQTRMGDGDDSVAFEALYNVRGAELSLDELAGVLAEDTAGE